MSETSARWEDQRRNENEPRETGGGLRNLHDRPEREQEEKRRGEREEWSGETKEGRK